MMKLFLVGFSMACVFLSSFYIDNSLSWNAASRAAMPLSLVLEHRFEIDSYGDFTGDKATINGHYYSDKGPLPGFLLVPILYAYDCFLPLNTLEPKLRLELAIGTGAFFLGALPFALVVFGFFKQKLFEHKFGVPLAMLFFFGSFLFAFSGTFFSHALNGLFIFYALSSVKKHHYVLAGIWLGMGFMTEYTTAIFALFWGCYLLWNQNYKGVFRFAMGILPFVILQLLYNYTITGFPLDFAYKFQENFAMNADYYGFGNPSIGALFHLTLSTYRGLFFYTPLLLVFLFILGRYNSWKNMKSFNSFALFSVVAYFLLFSASQSWYQGWSFGPRYLYPIPIILVMGVTFKTNLKAWHLVLLFITGAFGVFHTVLNKATVVYPPTEFQFPLVDVIIPFIKEGRWNNDSLLSHLGVSGPLSFALFLLAFAVILASFTVWHQRILNNRTSQTKTA